MGGCHNKGNNKSGHVPAPREASITMNRSKPSPKASMFRRKKEFVLNIQNVSTVH